MAGRDAINPRKIIYKVCKMLSLQFRREFQNAALSVMCGGKFNFTQDDIKIHDEEVLEVVQEVAEDSFGDTDLGEFGLVKNSDVHEFYKNWKHIIWQYLTEQAAEDGETPLKHLAINFTQADTVSDGNELEFLLCDFGITMAAKEIVAAQ